MAVVEQTRVQAPVSAPSPARRGGVGTSIVVGVVLAILFGSFSWAVGGDPAKYDALGALILAPVLIGFSIPILRRQADREGDRRMATLLIVALLVKLLGSMLRYRVAVDVYSGRIDAFNYHKVGVGLLEQFRVWNFEGVKVSGTGFIELLTGIVYVIIGPTRLGGFLFFSWLGFWGLFFFYKAFTVAVPDGRRLTYARLVFFLPSLVFWPSSIGKESWMMFCLGIAAYGAAHLLSGKPVRGLLIAATGLWWAALPRPHVAGLTGVAIAFAYLFRRRRSDRRSLGAIPKMIAFIGVAALAVIIVVQADEFLRKRGVDTSTGVEGVLGSVAERTSEGQSQFEPPLFSSPARAPEAVFTVLFRPTIVEAPSLQALAASLEGTFLLLFSLWRIRWMIGAIRSLRRRPYVAFALVHVGLLIMALSSISNWGILVRERVQVIPLYLVLLAIPPRGWRERGDVGDGTTRSPEPVGARK